MLTIIFSASLFSTSHAVAAARDKKPNILVIWGDDIGTWNISYNNRGITGQDEYSDGMAEHDRHIGELLKLLDDLKIADNTIVFYSTDNGPHYNTWPDAGTTPFRSEKNTNWEGAFRVPAFVRWPGHFPPPG